MTRAQTKALMPVLVAWSRGESIQVRDLMEGDWKDFENHPLSSHPPCPVCPDFSNDRWQWRVKPTPREFWVAMPKSGIGPSQVSLCQLFPTNSEYDIIHVREVVE